MRETEAGRYHMKKKMGIKAELELLVMKEGNSFVAYFPALDISTCGDTFEEATKRAEELPGIFFEETLKHGTLTDALEDLGWTAHKEPGNRHWEPPHVVGHMSRQVSVPVPA